MEATKQGRNLSTDEKNLLVQFLLQNSHQEKLKYGVHKEAEEAFGVSRKTVYRIWKSAVQQLKRGQPVIVGARVSGYEHKDKFKLDKDKVKSLSVLERSSIRKMASKLEVSKSLMGLWVKQNKLRPHTNAIKPTLTQLNKLARLKWCLSKLGTELLHGKLKYESMHNVIHIDEKWFYITKCSDRPQIGTNGEVLFDGKVGIFPFTVQEAAKRKSKNRPKGTMETKPIKTVTKAVIKECIIKQVIPAIKSKWPSTSTKHIFIQQDNAKPHISERDIDFIEAGTSDEVEEAIVRECLDFLSLPENSDGSEYNIQSLQMTMGY
ncbi:hypothetical protein AAHA92_15131 [Salvia divinorum]|uniref:DUF7769 domain-containing protein n=1 Tax=Salvia divinorum TaxID=28513 RepID=A0ABD1HDQ2_SALDI